MVLKVFPTSPVPADMTRSRTWNANKQTFDSGAYQGSSPYSKPLYRYGFNMANMPRTKQQSLESFINDLRDVEVILCDYIRGLGIHPGQRNAPDYLQFVWGTYPRDPLSVQSRHWRILHLGGSVIF
jgi:hypothetical protein